MPEPYKFPWGLKPLDPMVEKEFQRRVKDYNLNPTSSPSDSAPYSGPRTAWIRVFSNGISKDDEENGTPNGFVLGGTEGFDESYGFAPSAYDMEATDGKVTIGVDCWGDKHEISATPTDHRWELVLIHHTDHHHLSYHWKQNFLAETTLVSTPHAEKQKFHGSATRFHNLNISHHIFLHQE